MPEHLKVLVIILAAGCLVFWAGEKILCPHLVAVQDFRRRRNAWLGVILLTFLSHNFWIAALLTGWLTFLAARRDPNPLALYMTVLLAVPWYSMEIPGFGLVNYFLALNYYKLINLTILIPFLFTGSRIGQPHRMVKWTDFTIIAYLFYTNGMSLPANTATGAMREAVDDLLTVGIPYLAFSRMQIDSRKLIEILIGFSIGASVLGTIAPFETVKGWLVYESLRSPLGVPVPTLTSYLFRGDADLLRAMGSLGHSIVLGYVMMIGLILILPIQLELEGRNQRMVILTPLAMGLIFSLSRGPWVGCAVGIVCFFLVMRGSSRTFGYLIGIYLLALLVLEFFPALRSVIDFLPFVGGMESENIDYRRRLFEVGLSVFLQNPIFGAIGYITNPTMEQLRQGQGIIDIVNTYLAVGLGFGVVGLTLFVLPFLLAILSSAQGFLLSSSPQLRRLNAALLAALIAIMITIGTVSSISAVAPLYWVLIAMAVRFGMSSDDAQMKHLESVKSDLYGGRPRSTYFHKDGY